MNRFDHTAHSKSYDPGVRAGLEKSGAASATETVSEKVSAVSDAVSGKVSEVSSKISDETAEFFDNLQSAAKSGTAALNNAVQKNPTLALAGLVAAGALTIIAVRQFRSRPQTMVRRLQGDLIRQTRSMRKAIRDELRDSGLNSKVDQLGSSLSSIDWKPYIQPFIDRAASVADDAKAKIHAATK